MSGISVLIVTHNRARLIGDTIRSVLKQSFSDFELIIIDDGSTDNTEEIVLEFKDARIHYFKYERVGLLTKLRNIAVSKSTKPFIAFIDSDDLWHEQKLEKCLAACLAQGASVCLGDCLEFKGTVFNGQSRGEHLNKKTQVDIGCEILVNNVPLTYGSNIFLHRDVYAQVGGFNESMFHGDHDFICRALYSAKSSYVPEVLSFIRRHTANMSLDENNLDLRPLEEYNQTLKTIAAKNGISKQELNRITAHNHYRMASFAMDSRQFRLSLRHFSAAVSYQPKPKRIAGYVLRLFFALFKGGAKAMGTSK